MITDDDREALNIAKRRYRAWVDHMGAANGRFSDAPHTGELTRNPRFFFFQQYLYVRNLPELHSEGDLREQLLALGDRGQTAMDIYIYRHPDWARSMSDLAHYYFPTPLRSWAEAVGTYELSTLMNQVGRYCFVIAGTATADLDSWRVFHEWLAPFANEELNRRYTHLDDFDRAYAAHIVSTLYCVHGPEDWVIFMRLLDDETIVVINYQPGPNGVAIIPVRDVPEMPVIKYFRWKQQPPQDPHAPSRIAH